MILVTGATGFVGQRVVRRLREDGRPVRCLVRSRPHASDLERLGCELVEGDITELSSVALAVEGCAAVVHLVAIIAGRPEDFERVMVRGTADLVAAATDAGVGRFILMGSLGTNDPAAGTIPYYRAKRAMETSVVESGIAHVILRPSFVFGSTGGALARFVRIVRRTPIVPVLGPGTQRIQPIWVDDVATCVAAAAEGRGEGAFDLGGPEQLTWNELWLGIAAALGKRRRLAHIPFDLAGPLAALFERLPNPPLTRDQLAMLAMGDNVCDTAAAVAAFDLELVPLDEQIRRAIAA